jgi:UDP-glucose 4-epimerase
MTWLITGGSGYIGSHVVDQFLNAGKKVVVFGSLINGLKSRIDFVDSIHPEN